MSSLNNWGDFHSVLDEVEEEDKIVEAIFVAPPPAPEDPDSSSDSSSEDEEEEEVEKKKNKSVLEKTKEGLESTRDRLVAFFKGKNKNEIPGVIHLDKTKDKFENVPVEILSDASTLAAADQAFEAIDSPVVEDPFEYRDPPRIPVESVRTPAIDSEDEDDKPDRMKGGPPPRLFKYIEPEEDCPTNEYQEDIIKEAMNKDEGGAISAPMGCGKTLMALEMLRRYKKQTGCPGLIIASITLIPNWVHEIEKFYGDSFSYIVIHGSESKATLKEWDKDVDAYIVSPGILSKVFKENNLLPRVATEVMDENNFSMTLQYVAPRAPMLSMHRNIGEFIYANQWTSVFIDEAQNYTNISTATCRAIIGLSRDVLWCLSGTLISEPKPGRFLGYFMILHDRFFPSNLPDAKKFLADGFGGYGRTLVERKDNPIYKGPIVHQEIVEHAISKEEGQIYMMIKSVLDSLGERANELDGEDRRVLKRFRGWQAISYLRQTIVCPLLPIADIHFRTVKSLDTFGTTRIINTIIGEEFSKIDIDDWMQDVGSAKSSRIKALIEKIEKHPDEKQIVFTNFRMVANIIMYYLKDKPNIFTLGSEDGMGKRKDIIDNFKKCKGFAVLIVTYKLGAEGLNLQKATVAHLADFGWNSSEASQAIKRIDRCGQTAKEIFIYLYTSNLGIENIIFEKHIDKKDIIDNLRDNSGSYNVKKMEIDKVIVMINENENADLMDKIKWK